MFAKVLIANRGEIAARISLTLRSMGIKVVVVYSSTDRNSRYVLDADESYLLEGEGVKDTYLDLVQLEKVITESKAEAVHPGYGLLSENAGFVELCNKLGCVWLGPTVDTLKSFGLKHTARELAVAAGVPLCPGTDLINDLQHAREEALRIGFPLMLKSTAGGGGIGMQLCRSLSELEEGFESVIRLAQSNFNDAGVFLERYVEKARHIEVQVFGDGKGKVVALGERDCSVQRRHQKVVEETPAPLISEQTRQALLDSAVCLAESVSYRSAGTVEFLYDMANEEFYFLEVNTRLQVEHGVTELVTGVDIVEWMVLLGTGGNPIEHIDKVEASGAAIEVRVYAEDPAKDFLPSAGLITHVSLPEDVRCDGWIESGSEVSSFYDPLLVKIQTYGEDRHQALDKMENALIESKIAGIRTNLAYLKQIISDEYFQAGGVHTHWLDSLQYDDRIIEVLKGGTMTTVQDLPARLGFWNVGVPPSGPMDECAFRCANRLVGNQEGDAALEMTMAGPSLRFGYDTVCAITGAEMDATIDGEPVASWQRIEVRKGQVLAIGKAATTGCRAYLALAGGIDVPDYLGSKSTFTLGQFGGHGGRALVSGDVLEIAEATVTEIVATEEPIIYQNEWEIAVLYGPHGAPEFFTEADMQTFFDAKWEVHHNSARTGVRLIGPKPAWARKDGGEAGLHPSNIHDNAYGIGAIDFTGDMPVILGPDGPSLGGFVCPVTIIQADLWKMGQLRPGDKIQFVAVSLAEAERLRLVNDPAEPISPAGMLRENPILADQLVDGTRAVVRRSGDRNVLLELGDMELDLRLRFLGHLLYEWLEENPLEGVVDVTPGIRSLQVHYAPAEVTEGIVVQHLLAGMQSLPDPRHAEVRSRAVHLPLSWDDPSTQLAIDRYKMVNPDAPWCPSNIEFIRRINGLDSIDDVKRIVYDAEYLVMGLGDVYLGAPVATPLDPRHRLVTTKYNPARTWTPENAVGIGGAYMCIYGMEGPGGYQFVGRTVPVWNKYHQTAVFKEEKPWLLRFFDRIKWYEVAHEDLDELRRDMLTGQFEPKIEESTLKLGEYLDFLSREAESIEEFQLSQRKAFADERQRWDDAGLDIVSIQELEVAADDIEVPDGHDLIEAPMAGSVWKIEVAPESKVSVDQTVIILEAMKMEMSVQSEYCGEVVSLLVKPGASVKAGDPLMLVRTCDII